MNINKYINLAKQNKNLLIPVVALLGVFAYNMLGDFFSTSGGSKKDTPGSIALEKTYISEDIKKQANSTITESEQQRKIYAEEEQAIKEKALETNGTYMQKQIINDKDSNDKLKIKQLEEEKSKKNKEEIPSECKKDFISGIIVCVDKDGKTYFLIDGKKVYLTEELCKQSPYNSLNECSKFLLDLEAARKAAEEAKNKEKAKLLDGDERNVDSRGMKNSNGSNGANNSSNKNNKKDKETFGLIADSVTYQKYSMLLSTLEDEDQVGGNGTGIGSIMVSAEYLNELKNPTKTTDDKNTNLKPKLVIRPGSSYMAKLINPLNSLYADHIKPILDISDGDLEGYRLVGDIVFSEASNGVIIKGDKVVSPKGDSHSVQFTAIRYEGDELTPLFADEIDRHLGGRIGYSVLAALSSDYSGMMTTNSSKENTTVRPGETTAQKGGEVMSSTFEELAEQYVTEVKVNPQSMIVIFY